MKPLQRRLSAIVFTDIVGYSVIVRRDEAQGAKLLDRQRGGDAVATSVGRRITGR